jgi:hypothetical protein
MDLSLPLRINWNSGCTHSPELGQGDKHSPHAHEGQVSGPSRPKDYHMRAVLHNLIGNSLWLPSGSFHSPPLPVNTYLHAHTHTHTHAHTPHSGRHGTELNQVSLPSSPNKN